MGLRIFEADGPGAAGLDTPGAEAAFQAVGDLLIGVADAVGVGFGGLHAVEGDGADDIDGGRVAAQPDAGDGVDGEALVAGIADEHAAGNAGIAHGVVEEGAGAFEGGASGEVEDPALGEFAGLGIVLEGAGDGDAHEDGDGDDIGVVDGEVLADGGVVGVGGAAGHAGGAEGGEAEQPRGEEAHHRAADRLCD